MDWFSWLSKTNLETTLVYEFGLEFTRNELQEEDIPHFNHEFLMSMGISVAKHRLEIMKLAKKEASGLNKPLLDLKRAFRKTRKSVGKYLGRLMFHDDNVAGKASSIETSNNNNGELWRGALARKCNSEKEFKQEIMVRKNSRSLALSGPLDKRFLQDQLVAHKSTQLSGPLVYTPKSPIASGPFDVKAHEKAILALRSPKFSGPLDGRTNTNRSPRMAQANSGKGFGMNRSSPRLSGPLDGMGLKSPARSPRLIGNLDRDEFDEHSLWAKMFHDMKPT